MDDLKLYAKDELEGLLRIVKGSSDDTGMQFGLHKCAKATFKRGKLEKSDHVLLDEETMTKDREQEKVYKYLGVDGSSGIQHPIMKQKLKKGTCKKNTIDPQNSVKDNCNQRISYPGYPLQFQYH